MRMLEQESIDGIKNPHDGTRRVVAFGFRGPCGCDEGTVLAFTGTRIFFVKCSDCGGSGRREEFSTDASRLRVRR